MGSRYTVAVSYYAAGVLMWAGIGLAATAVFLVILDIYLSAQPLAILMSGKPLAEGLRWALSLCTTCAQIVCQVMLVELNRETVEKIGTQAEMKIAKSTFVFFVVMIIAYVYDIYSNIDGGRVIFDKEGTAYVLGILLSFSELLVVQSFAIAASAYQTFKVSRQQWQDMKV